MLTLQVKTHYMTNYAMTNILELISSTSQSKPSLRPALVIAEQPRIFQCRPEMSSERRSRNSAICSKPSAPPRSCLFAKISRLEPASFCE